MRFTSSALATSTKNETLGFGLKCGPPLSVVNERPAASNATVSSLPPATPPGFSCASE
jgi:hypothetical protein